MCHCSVPCKLPRCRSRRCIGFAVPSAYGLFNRVPRADKAVEQSDTASSNTTPCHGRAFLHSLLAQDLAAAAMCAQEAQPKQLEPPSVSKYKLRPRRTPRLTQVALQGKGQVCLFCCPPSTNPLRAHLLASLPTRCSIYGLNLSPGVRLRLSICLRHRVEGLVVLTAA